MIEVDPHVYREFFSQLNRKFVKDEIKDQINEYPSDTSRRIWDHFDKEEKKHRSIILFKPSDLTDFSREYFWRRNQIANKRICDYKPGLLGEEIEPLHINSEAFAKALLYIGATFDIPEQQKFSFILKAQILYKNFKKENNFLDEKREEGMADAAIQISIEDREMDKDYGTRFIETELQSIILKKSTDAAGILFLDVDDLTIINKQYGRDVGTAVLQTITGILKKHTLLEYAGRCGDDTFYGVLFPTKNEDLDKLCKHIKEDIDLFQWRSIADKLRVTCSFGWAVKKKQENIFAWFERSISGMLYGKELGGNTVQPGPEFLKRNYSTIDPTASVAVMLNEESKKNGFLRRFFS